MIESNPLDNLLKTSMGNLKEMIDVNTIMGDAVTSPDGTVIIPISRVTLGFAAGGNEWGGSDTRKNDNATDGNTENQFAGGSGAALSLNPVGFLVVGNNSSRFIPSSGDSTVNRIIDLVPELVNKLTNRNNEDEYEDEYEDNTEIDDDTTIITN